MSTQTILIYKSINKQIKNQIKSQSDKRKIFIHKV
jgi:hypothetical protein